jgi:hypothetical protein
MRRSTRVIVSILQWRQNFETNADQATTVTTGKIMTMEELSNVQGRAWEDVDVSTADSLGCRLLLTLDSIDVFSRTKVGGRRTLKWRAAYRYYLDT